MPENQYPLFEKLIWLINSIKQKGGDPSNISVLLKEIRSTNLKIDRQEILDFILSKKRLGYHSTPNDIAEFMAEIGRLFKPKSVIDISCGLANTLAYVDYTDDLTGIEIDGEIISLTKYLFPDLNLINADSLEYDFKKKYDLVISNFPYGYDIRGTKHRDTLEELFVKKALSILELGGTLICILPDTFLKIKHFAKLRHEILQNYCLEMVIKMPAGVIQNAFIVPAILVIKKDKQKERVYLTDLTDKEKIIENYLKKEGNYWISHHDLDQNWDPHFHSPEKWGKLNELSKGEVKPLSELADILLGSSINSKGLTFKGEILYLRPRNIIKGSLVLSDEDKYLFINSLGHRFQKALVKPGDVLVSRIFKNEMKAYVYKSSDPPAIASNLIYVLRSTNSDYLAAYLNTARGNEVLKEQISRETTGMIAPVISAESLRNILIPIIPVGDLNNLGDNYIKAAENESLIDLKDLLQSMKTEIQKNQISNTVTSEKLELIIDRLGAVEEQLNNISKNIDSILAALNSLSKDFNEVRQIKRDENEIISRLYLFIDQKMDILADETNAKLEFYIKEIKSWLERWDELETGSKKFLPQAEFLYDQLAKIKDADYSPFIVQYSRALENEILIKLFQAYHQHIISSGMDRNNLVKDEFENVNTQKFAKFIKSDNRSYTLGDMSFIMKLMKEGGKTFTGSRLLQNFKSFSKLYFDANVFERDFLDKLGIIVEKFRNKAAHPNILSDEIAKDFHIQIKECICGLMTNYIKVRD